MSRPLEAAEFAALMGALGPFEPAPTIAMAVSGGADSLALALLAAPWAEAAGGAATALIVDHGLRPGAAGEARATKARLAAAGVRAVVLRWQGGKPATGIEAAARAARYALLGAWCARHGVLHLLTAHQRDDQAETLLIRLGHGSGIDGLAAMAPVHETPWGRIVRPLLGVPPARLRACLEARGQGWIEDPTNREPAYARGRLRAAAAVLAGEGMTPDRLAVTARRIGEARAVLEAETAELLARAASVHPEGYARLDPAPFGDAPPDIARRALERVIGCIGAGAYPPRRARLDRLCRALRAGGPLAGRTLGGCLVRPAGGTVIVAREPAAASAPATLARGREALWDGRFRVRLKPAAQESEIRVGALGAEGWRTLAAREPAVRAAPVPAPARGALPALRDRAGILEVPHLGYFRDGRASGASLVDRLVFAPPKALAPTEFSVV